MNAIRELAAVLLLSTVAAAPGAAAEGSASGPPKKRSPWMVLPIVASNPKLGTSFGALGGYLKKFDAESQVSIFAGQVQYTSTDSWIAGLIARTSFHADHHRIVGIVAFGHVENDYDDYLGTGQPLRTDDDLHALAGRYLYRFTGNWFAGGQASFTNYKVTGESSLDDLTLETLGITGFDSNGIGAVLMHDSRDNQDMPTRGWFMNLNDVAYREWLGGDDSFDVYRLDLKAFFVHGKGHVFAARANNQFTSGAPAAAQATVLLRGYKLGQYLAKDMSSLEAEERVRISPRWGATVFVGGAWLYGGSQGTDSEGFYPSYGGGFQFIIKPVQRMLANVEYAHGDADNYGVYLKLGYAW